MKHLLPILILLASLSGCVSSHIIPEPITITSEGQRKTVLVSTRYFVGPFYRVDWGKAAANAQEQCRVMGTRRAEAVGVPSRTCKVVNPVFGYCKFAELTQLYECTNRTRL